MRKFAVVPIPDNGKRLISQHNILKSFPMSVARLLVPRLAPQITGVILDNEDGKELGYILDVPGFFIGWDRFPPKKRAKHIKIAAEKMLDKGVDVVVLPFRGGLLSLDEREYLASRNLVVLDGYITRMASMMASIERILQILKCTLHRMEVGIWRADTKIGEAWTKFLAPYFNRMVIGGEANTVQYLADQILESTGLACEVTEDVETCIAGKDLVVTTESLHLEETKGYRIIIWCNSLSTDYLKISQKLERVFLMESGWLSLPQDVYVGTSISPWDYIGVMEGLLYILSSYFRNCASNEDINLELFSGIRDVLGLCSIKAMGFINGNRWVSFDKFRMEFFKDKN